MPVFALTPTPPTNRPSWADGGQVVKADDASDASDDP